MTQLTSLPDSVEKLSLSIGSVWAVMSIPKRLFALSCIGLAFALPGNMASVAAPAEASGLDDVQIGERGDQTRIALICAQPCSLTKRSNSEFLLRGANADLALELGAHSKNVSGLTAISAGGGSLVKVSADRAVDYADAKNCVVGGRQAACIDLFFRADTNAQAEPVKVAAAKPVTKKSPALRSEPQTTPPVQPAPRLREPVRVASPIPSLRNGGDERLFQFANLSSPERFAPPQGVVLAKLQPITAPPALKGAVRLKPASSSLSVQSVDQQILTILGKDLTPEYCARAKAILNSDPWALNAMGDIGLCALVEGKAEEAEAILSRLLEYTPDHVEAHVGRALVAAQAGEKSIARKYFQDALNALPPIEESNRIVAAMSAL